MPRGEKTREYWSAYRQGKMDALFDGLYATDNPYYMRQQEAYYKFAPAQKRAYLDGIEAMISLYMDLKKQGGIGS